jgi:MazG family protein
MKMERFDAILAIMDRLLGPGGCPWDQEQTMLSIRSAPIEEACELKEAIECGDNYHIMEELGDLFLTGAFMAKLAEKEKRCTLDEALQHLEDKLIRRHPHVFGSVDMPADGNAVKAQWEQIKRQEKGKELRQSALDGIPKGLPTIMRAQKVIAKLAKVNYIFDSPTELELHGEGQFAEVLLGLLKQAHSQNIDIEYALQQKLSALEEEFRKAESCTGEAL